MSREQSNITNITNLLFYLKYIPLNERVNKTLSTYKQSEDVSPRRRDLKRYDDLSYHVSCLLFKQLSNQHITVKFLKKNSVFI